MSTGAMAPHWLPPNIGSMICHTDNPKKPLITGFEEWS